MSLNYFEQKEIYNDTRINELRSFISKIDEVKQNGDLCIYVTGSYARREASKYSDIDLFFINVNNDGKRISELKRTLINAELIKLTERMGFPEFSNDGEFLEVHNLADILDELGSRNDEYNNFFTARLLFILESTFIHNQGLYEFALKNIITRYYKDFHEHNSDFLPVFLTNDVVRFWKYLTINYEHKRNRIPASEKNKSHLKNFKLKFSRKMTCFSFLALVLSFDDVVGEDDIFNIVRMTPIQRLLKIKASKPNVGRTIDEILALYEWFMKESEREQIPMLEWIGNKGNRDIAFNKSREFGKLFYELLTNASKKELFRYLIL